MNVRIYIIAFFGLTIISHTQLSAKTIPIPVDSIFNHITGISKIKVIGYVSDLIMNYIDIESQDTLKLDCKWKKYSESSIKIIKENNSTYNSLEGTFPEVGETLLMLTYKYLGSRILFARKEKEHYRFWDPKSIPFANSVFFLGAKNGIYKPTELCKYDYQKETEFHCSDGFLIEENEFEKISWNVYNGFNHATAQFVATTQGAYLSGLAAGFTMNPVP
jgi:hypothetical protein